MVASDKLGEKAVNTQNEVLKEYIGIDELPPEITLAMKYNQLNIRYGSDEAIKLCEELSNIWIEFCI